MVNISDDLCFADEFPESDTEQAAPWKVIIADDEEEVHAVTHMVLDNFTFEGRRLHLLSAYSGQETQDLIEQHPDTAVILLDVVMEEDTTGLEVVKYIREQLGNQFVRIILRTGQPGQAPERQVTMEYDINDYKEKTELTAQKLFTTIIGLLRAYRDLKTIEKRRQGLKQVTTISTNLLKHQSLPQFVRSLLLHLSTFLQLESTIDQASPAHHVGLVMLYREETCSVLAGTGAFKELGGTPASEDMSPELQRIVHHALEKKHSLFSTTFYLGYFPTKGGSQYLIYLQSHTALSPIDQELLQVLETNIQVAFENIELNQEIVETQRDVIFTLGEVIETRAKQTRQRVKDVATYAHLLALKAGVEEAQADLLKMASPLRDVGILGISDAILHKQPPVSDEEWDIFRQHPSVGYEILHRTKQPILKTAADLALHHHERWDGQGYPQGLQGEQIHRLARILQIAERFDELACQPFPPETDKQHHLRTVLTQERGAQYDPTLVDLLLEHLEEFIDLHQTLILSTHEKKLDHSPGVMNDENHPKKHR
ncbi:DUF3369 domain-containing protein [candidate division KSB3 bacterium]|uniref:DUF3369 domain-containing protein n=1 Tax=candidate division KSB3 bacterium TaxID=2044937 RepID=A0A9D5Q6F3_9BACT|nr:DUF3369 domain-containing protein [candidate division KSB3 bacterium]MBD3325784.1 DUF3369 domain-containing protein [candidate division KSB3 bacterium]